MGCNGELLWFVRRQGTGALGLGCLRSRRSTTAPSDRARTATEIMLIILFIGCPRLQRHRRESVSRPLFIFFVLVVLAIPGAVFALPSLLLHPLSWL